MNAYQLDIDDDSPAIAYFPSVSLEPTTTVTAGWLLLYTTSGAATNPGQVGVGTSYHYTSLDGASLMLSWNGTGIDLVGSVSNALYNISLDGIPSAYVADPANAILASFGNLQNANHSLLLTTIVTNSTSPDAFLTFDRAVITYAPPPGVSNATATSQPIPDSDVAFMGQWTYAAGSTGPSLHTSVFAGDSVEATFQGSAITIHGLTSSYSGNFSVILDNITTNLSARSSYNNSDSLLFYATDLSQDTLHHVTIINQENRTLALRAGGMNVTSFGNSTTCSSCSSGNRSLPAGTIAAIALAAVLFLVLVGVFSYVCCVRRNARTVHPRTSKPSDTKDDIERVASASVPSPEELESISLSTSKGYGFGLGLRRGFTFTSRKNKMSSSSSGRSRNGAIAQPESHPMTPQRDRDEKQLSIFTLTEDLPVFAVDAPESEKLAPGWSYPVVRTPPPFNWKEIQGVTLPDLHQEPVATAGGDNGDDADAKTLASRQDEELAATLSLSPRTSEAPAVTNRGVAPAPATRAQGATRRPDNNQRPEVLRMRDTSPFRLDVSGIFGTRRGARDSKRSSGSGNSTWSKVRARLYRKAHRDDGRPSSYPDRLDSSSSSGPESVPVVMHQSGSAIPPGEAAPGSENFSFLDLTSSHVSLRNSKTATTSTPVEVGHDARAREAWSEDTSIRMVRIERSRDGVLSPKPDAPSTASGGSHPSDSSGAHAAPSAPTTHTQASSHFPFPITIPASSHIAHPPDRVPERHITPPPSQVDQYLHIPRINEPATPANSPTESVPFSVSEIYFRHSFSDYTGLDSRRASAASGLPPHPPLPHLDGSQSSTVTSSPPPHYIVQRVLGLPTSPPPLLPASPSHAPSSSSSGSVPSARRPGTAPTRITAPSRVGSLLGPRPRPSTAGSVRVTAAPQLPMQGGRSGLRSPR